MKNLSFVSILLTSLFTISNAETLKETIEQTKLTNTEIQVNQLKVKSEKKNIQIEESSYYPSLDFEIYAEKSQTKDNPKDGPSTSWDKKDGFNTSLGLEQLLYDGGKTSSLISQKKYSYLSTSYKYKDKNEKIILNIIKSYSELVEYAELNKVMEYSTLAHNKALEIALDKEEISGEVIETLKTKNIINAHIDKKLIAKEKYNKAVSNYENLTAKKLNNKICRPVVNASIMDKTLDEIIKLSLENSYKIKEQKEIIKKQSNKISQERSNYKPKVKLNLDSSYDKNLNTNHNIQKELSGTVTLNWNLYSGGKDKSYVEKETIKLNEEKKNLEKIRLDIIENITNLYNTYQNTKSRIKNFEESIKINQEILDITKNQLEDGTKTFIDALLAKNKITDAQSNKIKQEFILINKYYELLKEMSILNKTIVTSKSDMCIIIDVPNLINDKNEDMEDIDALLDSTNIDETQEELIKEIPEIKTLKKEPIKNIIPIQTNNKSLADKLSDTFKNENYTFDKESLTTTLLVTSSSFTKSKVNSNDKFKYLLDTFSVKFLKVLEENEDKIKRVDIESYTSSEYTKYKTQKEKDAANYALSKRRGIKVKNYFVKKSIENDLNTDWFNSKFRVIGKGPENSIKNDDGTENKKLSRRVVLKIIEN